MESGNKRIDPEKRLFENLFVRRSRDETFQVLSTGLIAFVENAGRLLDDALLLLEKDRWTSARFLLSTADEEMAKSYIMLDACRLDLTRYQSVLKRLCRAFYDHIHKYA